MSLKVKGSGCLNNHSVYVALMVTKSALIILGVCLGSDSEGRTENKTIGTKSQANTPYICVFIMMDALTARGTQ